MLWRNIAEQNMPSPFQMVLQPSTSLIWRPVLKKAIVPVHFAGAPCEMNKIMEGAKRHNLLVIEDACHALGPSYKGKKIGSVGDFTVFSFHPVKSITTGEGGAILTNDENFYRKLLSLRSHGIHKDQAGFNVMTELGYNYRLTDIQAALGVSQMKKLD